MTKQSHRSGQGREWSAGQLYDLFRNIRRRYVLYYAKQVDRPVSVDELVKKLSCWEEPIDAAGHAAEHHRSIYNSLRQTHLPKLEEAGLVEYDRDEQSVWLTEQATRVECYPTATTSVWGRKYRLSCLVVAVVAVVDLVATLPVVGLPSPVWSKGIYLAFILVTIGRIYRRYRRTRRFRRNGPDIVID